MDLPPENPTPGTSRSSTGAPVSPDDLHAVEAALGELRRDLRMVVDRLGTQLASLVDWRAALDAKLALKSDLATVPERMGEAMEAIEASQRELLRRIDRAFEQERAAAQRERSAHMASLDSAVSGLIKPLLEDWSPSPAAFSELSAKVESVPDRVVAAVTSANESHAGDLAVRLEQVLRDLGKRHNDALIARLEAVTNSQRLLLANLEEVLREGVERIRGETSERLTRIEEAVSAMRTVVVEALATRLEELPEVLVDSLGYAVETHSAEVISRLEQLVADNRRALAEVNEVAARRMEKTAHERAATAAAELERLVVKMTKRVAAQSTPVAKRPKPATSRARNAEAEPKPAIARAGKAEAEPRPGTPAKATATANKAAAKRPKKSKEPPAVEVAAQPAAKSKKPPAVRRATNR